jgi:hypothetical protein
MAEAFENSGYYYAARAANVYEAARGNKVISGCAVSEKGAGANMSVDTAAGTVFIGGAPVQITASNDAITAADASNDRLDLISVGADGTIDVTDGTPAANPYPPDLAADHILLGVVTVAASTTQINDSDIADSRIIETGSVLMHSGSGNTTTDGIVSLETVTFKASDFATTDEIEIDARIYTTSGYEKTARIFSGDTSDVDNFDDGDLTGWTTGGTGTVSASTDQKVSGTHSMKMENGAGEASEAYRAITNTIMDQGVCEFSCWVRTSDATSNTYFDIASTGTRKAGILISSDQFKGRYNSAASFQQLSGANPSDNTWYKLVILYYPYSRRVDYYVLDASENLISYLLGCSCDTTTINRVYCDNDTASTTDYFDDVTYNPKSGIPVIGPRKLTHNLPSKTHISLLNNPAEGSDDMLVNVIGTRNRKDRAQQSTASPTGLAASASNDWYWDYDHWYYNHKFVLDANMDSTFSLNLTLDNMDTTAVYWDWKIRRKR